MAKVARKARFVPAIRTLATVIDEMAVAKAEAAASKKRCELLDKELSDYLGEDMKKDGVYQGDLYTMVLKRIEPAPMYIDNKKVLALVGAKVYEELKSPRETVKPTFIKKVQ
jgi:hypothetical protein